MATPSVILAGLRELGRMLGVGADDAVDMARSEKGARLAMSRRGLFVAAGAVAAGAAFSFPGREPRKLVSYTDFLKRLYPKDLPFVGVGRSPRVTWDDVKSKDCHVEAARIIVRFVDHQRGLITLG